MAEQQFNKAPQDQTPSPPPTGPDLRLKEVVKDALAITPGGADLDRYFGISSGTPEQPRTEAQRSEDLIRQLQAASTRDGDLVTRGNPETGSLLDAIAQHANNSGVDPDALRALMRGPKKPK